MKRELIMLFTLFLFGVGIAVAQTRVRGVVVDDVGDPVIGATIQIQGTTQGTVTDIDGNFSLSAPADGSLIISYVGYQTRQVPVSEIVKVDRKSTRLNSSHVRSSYAVFCLKKKT